MTSGLFVAKETEELLFSEDCLLGLSFFHLFVHLPVGAGLVRRLKRSPT